MTDGTILHDARRLLDAHADRALTGPIEDPGVLAAVVGVERLVVHLGGVDGVRSALAGEHGDERVREVVADVEALVVTGIENRETGDSLDASALNPDAGGYEVVTDAELVRAGVRAAQRSFGAMPYYRLRYGDRGSRFASTDSGWLLAMAEHDEEHALRQVRWLARLLANRGMPSRLLESHLHALVVEVRSVDPRAVGALPAVAGTLGDARRRCVDDDLLAAADGWAEEALGPDLPVRHTGLLVAAAVADVLVGLAEDDRPCVGWLADPARVGERGADAVLAVRDRVRAAAG
ncbi:hypothetical protein [Phycicoccus flavus]|uniref:Uncharacterized protein n=1 Tax=Phycicoccus flavus TaxID=2502783 RepID=A0A8T6R437_9MICO|nr:hypothetical protein [Phycicoccus flavus]NHA69239.1 hypothetical protein [Phycicoccus flavus]